MRERHYALIYRVCTVSLILFSHKDSLLTPVIAVSYVMDLRNKSLLGWGQILE